jgi:uncharacterized Tic20 family protein
MHDWALLHVVTIMLATALPFVLAAARNRFNMAIAALFICLISAKLVGVYLLVTVSTLLCAYLIISDKNRRGPDPNKEGSDSSEN